MSMTPVHPALLLERPLSEDEMMDALRWEGMFGIGMAEDIRTARKLAAKGLLLLEEWDKGRGWHVCLVDPQTEPGGLLSSVWCDTCARRTDGLAYCLHCGTHQLMGA